MDDARLREALRNQVNRLLQAGWLKAEWLHGSDNIGVIAEVIEEPLRSLLRSVVKECEEAAGGLDPVCQQIREAIRERFAWLGEDK